LITIDLPVVLFSARVRCAKRLVNFKLGCLQKKENKVRMMFAASGAPADEVGDASSLHCRGASPTGISWRASIRGRRPGACDAGFTDDIAGACPSERQNLRVRLRNDPSLQFPNSEVDANLTGNHAIDGLHQSCAELD
jgi:hypothetical protein